MDVLEDKQSLPRTIGGYKYTQIITDQDTRHR